jgi:hypothetical protein
MFENVTGKEVVGHYKRAGRDASVLSLEVTALLKVPNARGENVSYLFGTRTDADGAGAIVTLRADCFNPKTVKVNEAKEFKPIEGVAEGEWFISLNPNAAFQRTERVAAEEDREWAMALGAKPLLDFVAPEEVKAA